MTTSILSKQQAEKMMSVIVGEYAWSVRCMESHILQMEFGEPHLRIQGPRSPSTELTTLNQSVLDRRLVIPTGRWSLFVEDGFWQVHAGQSTCQRADPELSKINHCLDQLSGQKVKHFTVENGKYSLNMLFDLSGFLDISTNIEFDENSQWIFFSRDGWNISFDARGRIEIEYPDDSEAMASSS